MILRLFLLVYGALWALFTPLALAYLVRRGRKDPLYRAHLAERFGICENRIGAGAVWIHAVSLGEMRSAAPLVSALLARGERVLITHFTPAGRRESARAFGPEIADGRVQAVWVPFETRGAWGRFLRQFRPQYGLVMEIEIWPAMVAAARAHRVPLFMCNAQYPSKSLARDSGGLRLRQRVMREFAGALVKSDLQAQRFAGAGVRNIHVTGELRFDQEIAPVLTQAGAQARGLAAGRRVLTIASAVAGEDASYIALIHDLRARALTRGEPAPLIVYVPRAPERAEPVAALLAAEGFSLIRRSEAFGAGAEGLRAPRVTTLPDILLGDSFGEMYFYLSLADQVVVGGSFIPAGAHNIIEPLALGKPVFLGPSVGTIEYPFVEAQAAGVAQSLPDVAALARALEAAPKASPAQIEAFFSAHSGGAAKTLAALPAALKAALTAA